jgi:uncharacterized membrane protein
MTPVLTIALGWLLFGGLHIGLATGPVRRRLVARLEEGGFIALFSTLAAVAWSLLVVSYAGQRGDGPPGLALGTVPWLRGLLMATTVAGIVLAVAGNAVYDGSPYAMFVPGTAAPRGLARITRHPMFAGLALFAAAHALLATRLAGTVAFTGLALLAVLGGWHQDRKLRPQRGAAFAAYLASTSAVPFGAVLAGRQRLGWRDLPLGYLVAGLGVAWGLRRIHASIFARDGLYVILAVLGVAAIQLLLGARRTSRAARSKVPAHPAAVRSAPGLAETGPT